MSRLQGDQHFALRKHLELHREKYDEAMSTQADLARQVEQEVGFRVTIGNLKGAYRDVGFVFGKAKRRPAMEERVKSTEETVACMEEIMDDLDSRVSSLEDRMQKIEEKLSAAASTGSK